MSTRFVSKAGGGWQVTSTMKPFQFPGGERHIKVGENEETPLYAVLNGAASDDLIDLGMWADIMHQRGLPAFAYVPYAPAARADRGEPFGARVYANIINSFGLDKVVIFDPHSPVITELIDNVTVVESTDLIRRVFRGHHPEGAMDKGYVGVIAPDKGAVHRAQLAADALRLPLFKATKERVEATGKLSNFQVEDLPAEGRFLVVDDICDGGGTFCGLAEAAGVGRERLTLWVSHGIFSGRAPQLTEYYAEVHTTDSHPGAHNPEVGAIVHSVIPYLINH